MKIESQNGNRVQEIKKVQRIADVKPNLYYTKRGLTKYDQTGETSDQLIDTRKMTDSTIKEVFEMENARNENSRHHNSLNTEVTEKDIVKEFKNGFKANKNSNTIIENFQ